MRLQSVSGMDPGEMGGFERGRRNYWWRDDEIGLRPKVARRRASYEVEKDCEGFDFCKTRLLKGLLHARDDCPMQ